MRGRKSSAGMGITIAIVFIIAGLGFLADYLKQPGMAAITGAAIYEIPAFCKVLGDDEIRGCVDLNADGFINYSDEEMFSEILAGDIVDPEILVYADFDGNNVIDNIIDFQQCFVPWRDFYIDQYGGVVTCNRRRGEDDDTLQPNFTGCKSGCPDLNSDGYVDRDDYDLILSVEGENASETIYPMADITGDGFVTEVDEDCWQLYSSRYVLCNMPVHANHTNIDACADLRNEYNTGNDAFVNDTDLLLFEAYKDAQNPKADFDGDGTVNWLDKFVFNEYYNNTMVACDVYHAPWHIGGADQYMNSSATVFLPIEEYFGLTQAFNSSYDGFLTKVRLYLNKSTGGKINLTVEIWNASSSDTPIPTMVYAATTYKNFEIDPEYNVSWVTIPFIKPPFLEKGRIYHIAIKATNNSDSVQYKIGLAGGNPYSAASHWSNTSGGAWAAQGEDFLFFTYMTTACADLNSDGIVNSQDDAIISSKPDGITPNGTERWNVSYDINNDSQIDLNDALLVANTGLNLENATINISVTTPSGKSNYSFGGGRILAQPFEVESEKFPDGLKLQLLNLTIFKGSESNSKYIKLEIRGQQDNHPDMSTEGLYASTTLAPKTNTAPQWFLVNFLTPANLSSGTYFIVLSTVGTEVDQHVYYNSSTGSGGESLIYGWWNTSESDYNWSTGSDTVLHIIYTGNTFDFNGTYDVNNDQIINETDYKLVKLANDSYSGEAWTPLIDFNARFNVYEESLDKGLGFDVYMGNIETCGFTWYLSHTCGDGRCSMKEPYNENYQNCPRDCPPCNNDSFCARSENQSGCIDCISLIPGVEYSKFQCSTTNFDDIADISALTDVVIEHCNYGKIYFPGPIDFRDTNIDDYVSITYNNISININMLPQLSKRATLTFYNLTSVFPVATRNGNYCEGTSCTFNSFDGKDMEIDVDDFDISPVTYFSSVDHAPIMNDFNLTLSTNFTRYVALTDIESVSNAVFSDILGFGSVKFLGNANFSFVDADSNIHFDENDVEIEVVNEPKLNTSVEIVIYDIDMTYPVITKEGKRCEGTICEFRSYVPGDYLIFRISQLPSPSIHFYANESAPSISKFNGNTTSFLRGAETFTGDIESASKVTLDKLPYGKIEFREPVNFSLLDADSYVGISENRVFMNMTAEPRLDKHANITFYNVSHVYPEVYLNGTRCSTCAFKSFDDLTNNVVIGISNYRYSEPVITLAEAAPDVSAFDGNTTNFSRKLISEIENVGGVVLEKKPYSRINFATAVNVTDTNLGWSDTANIDLTSSGIFINRTSMPGLDVPAIMILKNLSLHHPKVYFYNSSTECASPYCSIISYYFESGCDNNCTMVLYMANFRNNGYLVIENNTLPQFVNGPIETIEWNEDHNHTFESIDYYFFDADNKTLDYSINNINCNNITFDFSSQESETVNMSFYPDPDWSGECLIRIIASDGNSSVASNAFRLAVLANLAPVFSGPISDQAWGEDNNITISLLSYFSDPNNDSLTFSHGLVGAIKDKNISVSIDNSTGIATFAPVADWSGTRYVYFTAYDAKSSISSNYIALTVNPINDAPACDFVYNVVRDEDANVSIDMGLYCSDVDDSLDSLNFTLTSAPVYFNVSYYTNKTILFDPAENWNGYESFRVKVTDPDGLSATTNSFVISLTGIDDPVVVLNSTLFISFERDNNYSFDASDYLYDPDNSAIYYYTQQYPTNISADVNINTGWTTISPAYRWYGNEWLNITLEDSVSSGTVYLNITATKNVSYIPLLMSNIPDMTWPEETVNESLNLYDYFDDLSMTFTSSGEENITIEINSTTGNVTMTPDANFTGTNVMTFTASNAQGSDDSNIVTLTITNVNDGPHLAEDIPTQYTVKNTNTSLDLDMYFADIDGDDLNFTATNPPDITVHINNLTNVAVLEPETDFVGTNSVTFTAFDPDGESTSSNLAEIEVISSNTTISNSYVEGVYYDGSYRLVQEGNTTIATSDVADSTIIEATIQDSNITNSTITNSDLDGCTVINSTVVNYDGENCYIINSDMDPTGSGTGITSYSDYSTSSIVNSNVTNSTIEQVNLNSCSVNNSWVRKTNGTSCVVSDGSLVSGSLTYPNGTATTAAKELKHIINYPPTAAFAYSSSNLDFNFTDASEDTNIGTDLDDNLTYSWSFGDSSSNSTANISHAYSSSGIYTVSLTVADIYWENDTESVQVTAGTISTGTSGGGGGGGGRSCSDECSPQGALGCADNTAAVCGNYDSDSCLEWGELTPCGSLAQCMAGVCEPAECIEDWICTTWEECEGNTQTRECEDFRECGTTILKPALEQSCEIGPEVEAPAPTRRRPAPLPPPAPIEEEKFELIGLGIWELVIVALVVSLLLTGSAAVIKKRGRRGKPLKPKKDEALEYTQLESLKSAINRDVVRGVSEKDIRSMLEDSGWPAYMVNQAMKEVNESLLREPVERDIEKGFKESTIRSMLIKKGWPEMIVDDTIDDVNLSILKRAVKKNLQKGFKMSEIRKGLVDTGWPDSLVDMAIKNQGK